MLFDLFDLSAALKELYLLQKQELLLFHSIDGQRTKSQAITPFVESTENVQVYSKVKYFLIFLNFCCGSVLLPAAGQALIASDLG